MITESKDSTNEHTVRMTGVYKEHKKGLDKYSFFKLNDRELSEDLVQDTFMKTWMYLVRGGKIEIMRAFLYHALNCRIIDEYRKRKTVSLDALLEKGFEPNDHADKHIPVVFDGKLAMGLIQKLPQKYEVIMHLTYIQHLSIKEIAIITRQTENTVSVQIHRGLKKLRFLYDHPH